MRLQTFAPRALAALAVVLAAGACDFDRLLRVDTPSRLPEDKFLQPANAALISSSAVADYECALGAYQVASGLGAGEFVETTQTASRWSFDRRNILPVDAHYSTFGCATIGVYTPINTARYTNDQAVRALEGWTDAQVPNRTRMIALNSALAGFSLILLGEGFCEGTINVGPLLTSQQLFDSAEVRLTRAIEVATPLSDAAGQAILNLARVGRARARINKGDKAGAAADAQLVPVGFVYNATADQTDSRRNNRVYAQNNVGFSVSVGAAYRNLNDPRVVVTDANRLSSDQVNPLFLQTKFNSLSAPFPIATGVEAQLILAEAQGGAQGAATLSSLRGRSGVGLPALTAEQTANFTATLVEERRRELFVQGNRYFDVRRFNLTQEPATGTQYPKAGFYGDQRCWPLPDVERLANPNIPDTP
jgi:starch-binding outer membrane protein, SusD/RagB family